VSQWHFRTPVSIAQLVEGVPSHASGRWFDSCRQRVCWCPNNARVLGLGLSRRRTRVRSSFNTPPYCCFCGPRLSGYNPCVPGHSLQLLPHSCGHLSLMLLTAPHPLNPAYPPRHSIAIRPPCMESTCHVLQSMDGCSPNHVVLWFCSMLVSDPLKSPILGSLFGQQML
jgi:hypothetical protein